MHSIIYALLQDFVYKAWNLFWEGFMRVPRISMILFNRQSPVIQSHFKLFPGWRELKF